MNLSEELVGHTLNLELREPVGEGQALLRYGGVTSMLKLVLVEEDNELKEFVKKKGVWLE